MYSQAIRLNPDPIYYSNRAACHSILKNYDLVIADCSEALKLDSLYVKALTRRAHAYENIGNVTDALNGKLDLAFNLTRRLHGRLCA